MGSRARKWIPTGIGVAIGVAILASVVVSGMRHQDRQVAAVAEYGAEATVTVRELATLWKENTAAFAERYAGRIVAVEGQVDRVGVDLLGRPFVIIGGPYDVDCSLTEDDRQTVAKLQQGAEVIVVGKLSPPAEPVMEFDIFECRLLTGD